MLKTYLKNWGHTDKNRSSSFHGEQTEGGGSNRPQQQEPSTSTQNGQKKRLPSSFETLNLYFAIHRYFTFQQGFKTKYCVDPHLLAEVGLYCKNMDNHVVCCSFCDFQKDSSKLKEIQEIRDKEKFVEMMQREHGCKIASSDSKNIPMGNVKSVLNYKYEAHRLYSLLRKEVWHFVDPYSLAKSGFYYTGDEDNCRCVFCNLEVRGWEQGDTADKEHKRWNPACPFLKDPNSVTNIEIGSEQISVSHDCIGKTQIGANPFSASGSMEKYGQQLSVKSAVCLPTPHDLNINEWSPPKYQRYTTFNSRLDSFKNWPKCLNQTPFLLAKAGFFYTGKGDRTICFHCNVGLKDWAPNDDPFNQHVKWNSACQYLIMCQGPDYIRNVIHSKNAVEPMEVSNDVIFGEEENCDMKCRKCIDGNISKVNLPCGHMTFCHLCESDYNCLVCNERILAEIKVPGL